MVTRRSLYLKHVARTGPEAPTIEVERTEGVFIYDTRGKRYFDLASGIGPSILGHQFAPVNEAIRRQTDQYLHTMVYGMHIQNTQVDYAEAILNHLPDSFEQVYFLSSGAEAIEAALKMGKIFSDRKRVIAASNAYHGSTIGAESLRSDTDFIKQMAPLVPGVSHIRFNHLDDLKAIDEQVGVVIMEPVQAEAGIVVPDSDYMLALRNKCDEVGAILIFDEIQMGMGRTGFLWAHEAFGVVPDILVLGKALGGGLPLSAVVTRKEIMQSISHKVPLAHLTTFGGHPLCCAAGKAVFDTITGGKMWERAEAIGLKFEQLLKSKVPGFKRHGAMFGIDLRDEEHAVSYKAKLQSAGIISDLLLFRLSMVRMAPPLIISDEEIEMASKAILSVEI